MQQIVLENIDFGYNKDQLLFKKLSLSIDNYSNTGKIIGLMGNSGCGKSTLLKLILKVVQPQCGKITTNPTYPVFGYLPQELVLFEHLSPMANALYLSKTKNYKKKFDISTFEELTRSLNLKDVLENKGTISELSGGQKQRLALLQALSIYPDFLILDEPTTGIDAQIKLQFLSNLKLLVRKYNLLVIYVTHNRTEAELITDEIMYLTKSTDKTINQVFLQKTVDFIQTPPIVEAINVFKYPTPNIIELSSISSHVTFNFDEDESAFIEDKNIHFSNEFGILYKVISSNQVYTTIELIESKQQLVFRSELLKNENYNRISFVGRILLYKNGILSRIIKNG